MSLEKAIYGDDAATQAVSIAECRQDLHCLAFSVDRLAASGRVLAPIGNESPMQRIERHIAGLVIAPNDE